VRRGAYSSSFFCPVTDKMASSNYSPDMRAGDEYCGDTLQRQTFYLGGCRDSYRLTSVEKRNGLLSLNLLKMRR